MLLQLVKTKWLRPKNNSKLLNADPPTLCILAPFPPPPKQSENEKKEEDAFRLPYSLLQDDVWIHMDFLNLEALL